MKRPSVYAASSLPQHRLRMCLFFSSASDSRGDCYGPFLWRHTGLLVELSPLLQDFGIFGVGSLSKWLFSHFDVNFAVPLADNERAGILYEESPRWGPILLHESSASFLFRFKASTGTGESGKMARKRKYGAKKENTHEGKRRMREKRNTKYSTGVITPFQNL